MRSSRTKTESRISDLTGDLYGRLYVVADTGAGVGMSRLWRCQCYCGNFSNISHCKLVSGGAKDCGCISGTKATTTRSPSDEMLSILKWQYSLTKAVNKRRGFNDSDFICFNDFVDISLSPCTYCGVEYSKVIPKRGGGRNSPTLLCNGIDRIDTTKGYIDGNCAPCCSSCNRAKWTMTVDEFTAWIKRAYDFNFK